MSKLSLCQIVNQCKKASIVQISFPKLKITIIGSVQDSTEIANLKDIREIVLLKLKFRYESRKTVVTLCSLESHSSKEESITIILHKHGDTCQRKSTDPEIFLSPSNQAEPNRRVPQRIVDPKNPRKTSVHLSK